MNASLRGRTLWMELLTTDTVGATAFYPAVFGWGIEVFTALPEPYTMWTANGVPIGGTLSMPPDAKSPPSWLIYLGSDDVDATVAAAIARGARVHLPPRDVPTIGRYGVLGDPHGASFAVYRPASHRADPEQTSGVGEFSWHELATPEPEAALDFYSHLFGFKKGGSYELGAGTAYQYFRLGRKTIGGVYRQPSGISTSSWLHYVRVADIHVAAQKVAQHRGRVINGPMAVPNGDEIAVCTDPKGAVFALHQVRSGSPSE